LPSPNADTVRLESGQRHRNAELVTVRDGRVTEAQVFFGGRYQPSPAARWRCWIQRRRPAALDS
jgi:hypothetical protein